MNHETPHFSNTIETTKSPQKKAKTFLIICGSLIWSLLFFEQYIGLNIFLFAILSLIGLFIIQKEMFLKKGNLTFVIGLFISAFFVFYYGAIFPFIMFILSLIFISTLHYPEKISILTRPFLTGISALNFWLVSWVQKLDITPEIVNAEIKEKENSTQILKYVFLIAASVLTVMLFFFLYRNSNEVFRNLTDSFELNFSPELLGFTLLGILVLNVIFNTEYFNSWSDYEMNIPDQAQKTNSNEINFLKNRNFILAGLLVILNLLIFMINCIDISYLLGWMNLPEEIGHSAMVHNAIGSVIFSIIVAMIIILIIYKKSQTDEKINKWLLLFAFIWIIQNFILVFTSMEKNYQYIAMHDLTYKRIGVMVYLTLTIIGLAIVFVKLKKDKSNWYVFRTTSHLFYMALLLLSVFNWPVIVTSYNLNSAKEKGSIDDTGYLINLDDRNLLLLSKFANANPQFFREDEIIQIEEKIENLKNTNYSWQEFTVSNYLLQSNLK